VKNILILADGLTAEKFIEQINGRRVADNHYVIVANGDIKLPQKMLNQIEKIDLDPTSYSRMRKLFNKYDFSVVFIVLSSMEESGESLKNIRRIGDRIPVYLLDSWNAFSKMQQTYTHIIDSHEMLANRLYDFLPGVPVIAKNVGLGEGEIMDVLVPFGSTFAFRHVGSISQVKWKIVAIYRNKKLILPTNATMIRPQDMLLIVGRPQILHNIFLRINNRKGFFPEPFGRNLYLFLDFGHDTNMARRYLEEAIFLLDKLKDRNLTVRIYNPGNFEKIDLVRSYENDRVDVVVCYENKAVSELLNNDLRNFDIGLFFCSFESFENEDVSREIYDMKKLACIFGRTPLFEVEKSVAVMTTEEDMEAISSTSFYISETMNLEFHLCDLNPEGDFDKNGRIVEHYETLSHIFHYPVRIEKERVNPVRRIAKMAKIIQIVPMKRDMTRRSLFNIFSTRTQDHLLSNEIHPKLLIPVEAL